MLLAIRFHFNPGVTLHYKILFYFKIQVKCQVINLETMVTESIEKCDKNNHHHNNNDYLMYLDNWVLPFSIPCLMPPVVSLLQTWFVSAFTRPSWTVVGIGYSVVSWYMMMFVVVVVVAAAAQLFWKPAELNVGPPASLSLLTLHGCCLTQMFPLSGEKMVSLIRITPLRAKPSVQLWTIVAA